MSCLGFQTDGVNLLTDMLFLALDTSCGSCVDWPSSR
jgi:hypothetical protein